MKYSIAMLLYLSLVAVCGDSDSTTSTTSPTASTLTTFHVEGAAMAPTLEDGDLIDVIAYGDRLPERGDVVIFRPPTAPHREFAKRVIGVPGERVEIDASTGIVSVSGEPLSEPYVQGTTGCPEACIWMLPEAGSAGAQEACGSARCYFVLGDNRPNSSDSRQGWLVPVENILGFVEVD